MMLFYKKTNHLKTNSETTLNCHETVLQFKCKDALIENNKTRLSYKHNFNLKKLKEHFNTIPMSTILPNCISRLVTNRSQQTNGSQNHNNPIKHLMRSYALLFLLLGFNAKVTAQITNLKFSSESATYSEISSGTTLIAGGNVPLGNAALISPLTNLPFPVRFQGNDYTTFGVSATGQLRLGAPTNVVDNTQASMNIPSIYAMWDNFTVGTTASGGGVTFQVSGTAPNRVLTVQWKVTKAANTATAFTFQVKLYERPITNQPTKIELCYPPNAGNAVTGLDFSAGINGLLNTHYISIYTANHAASKYELYTTNNSVPASTAGFKYIFEPITLAQIPGGIDPSRFGMWLKADGEKRTRTLLNVPAANRTASTNFSTTLTATASVLNTNSASTTGTAWTGLNGNSVLPQDFITMDLGSIRSVDGVAIQGRGDFDQYVRDFTVVVADDAAFTINVRHLGLFNGIEISRFYINYADFYEPVATRYVRIIPTGRLGTGHRGLRCDAYTYTSSTELANNTALNVWEDESKNNNDGYAWFTSTQPLYRKNQINFNPSMQFANASNSIYLLPQLNNVKSSYWVVQDETATGANNYHVLYGDQNTRPYFHGGTNGQVFGSGGAGLYGATDAEISIWKDGSLGGVNSTAYNFGPNGYANMVSTQMKGSLWNGITTMSYQGGFTRAWQGKIAELIVITGTPLTTDGHERVQSYLAMKYGITSAHDYKIRKVLFSGTELPI